MKIDIYRYIYSWFSYWTWWFSRAMFIGSWFMESPEVPNKRAGDWILIPQWQCFCSPSFIYLYVKTQNFRILWSVTYFLSAKNSQAVSTCFLSHVILLVMAPWSSQVSTFPTAPPVHPNVELPQDGGNAQVIDLRLGAPRAAATTRGLCLIFSRAMVVDIYIYCTIYTYDIYFCIYIYCIYIYIRIMFFVHVNVW